MTFKSNVTVSGASYAIEGPGRLTFLNTFNDVYLQSNISMNNGNYYYYGTYDLLNFSEEVLVDGVGLSFVNPYLYDDDGLSYLHDNEFTSFVVFPGDAEVVDFVLSNTTGNLSFTQAPQLKITLSSSSPYWQNTERGYCWVIPKTRLSADIFKQQNGQSYYLKLMNLNDTYNEYTWTIQMSAAAEAEAEQSTQEQINSGIQDLNNFLNNDTINSNDITSNMPSTNIQNPTENAFNNIFTSFRNAFVNDNPPDFVFEIPFSNGQTITIPANYISSKLPSVIILLIQGFYWFIICRYIVKDIAATVENAKSGKILDTKDGNIKTELL